MSRFRSFLALSTPRKRLFVVAFALTLLVRISLALCSFRRTGSLLARLLGSGDGRSPVDDGHSMAGDGHPPRSEIRWAVTTAGNQIPNTTCLPRALVAHTLCRRYGHESDLYVGVDRESETFVAHSWVESHGEVVVGDEVDLDSFETLGVVDP
jgi:hypothetical protein